MKKRIISLLLVLSMLLCVLPAVSAADVAQEPKLTSFYLTLNKGIALNFMASGITDEYYVLFNGSEKISASNANKSGDNYIFTYRNVSPLTADQDVTITLYNGDGNPVAGQEFTKSIQDYCVSVLNNSTASDELKTLVVDLLVYCEAFQVFKDMTPTATNCLDGNQKALATTAAPDLESQKNTDYNDGTAYWVSATLSLTDSVEIRFDVDPNGIDPAKLTLDVGGNTIKHDGKAYEYTKEDGESSTYYSFYYDKLSPAQMRDVVTAQVCDDGTPVGNDLQYSIQTYAYGKRNDSEASTELKALTEAMMKYGDSTEAWRDSSSTPPVEEEPKPLLEDNFDNGDLSKWSTPVAGTGTASVVNGELKLSPTYSGSQTIGTAKNVSVVQNFDESYEGKVRIVYNYRREVTNPTYWPNLVNLFHGYLTILGDGKEVAVIESRGAVFTVYDGGPASDSYKLTRYNTTAACAIGTEYKIEVVVDTVTDTYDLYIGGVLVDEGRKLAYEVDSVTGIKLGATDNYCWSNARHAYFDNLKVTPITE